MGNVYDRPETDNVGAGEEENAVEIKHTNNLEPYLNDVYKNECLYKILADEVEFIQTGIETLAQKFVDRLLNDLNGKGAVIERQSDIIKVGSIYEGTKNKYPDEFDFIFMYHSRMESTVKDFNTDFGFRRLYETIEELLGSDKIASQLSFCRGRRKLYFSKCLKRHGPAEMLEFIYKSNSDERKLIHVDLVPAIRILDDKLDDIVCSNCTIAPFRAEILSTGKCLVTTYLADEEEYSFTETEVYFIKNILSKTHQKVYRIIKYLINGHGDNDSLDRHFRASTYRYCEGYTSYMIKTMIIQHHYRCQIHQSEELGPCVLQVLEDIDKYMYKDDFPRIVPKFQRWYRKLKRRLVLRDLLKSMIDDLRSLERTEMYYNYEKIGSKGSVSRQYIDSKWSAKLTKDIEKSYRKKPKYEK